MEISLKHIKLYDSNCENQNILKKYIYLQNFQKYSRNVKSNNLSASNNAYS